MHILIGQKKCFWPVRRLAANIYVLKYSSIDGTVEGVELVAEWLDLVSGRNH
jgi:hypothetical protein